MKPHSINLGEVDLAALAEHRCPLLERNAGAAFYLFRIGDAWASRNLHTAMLDAMRVCKDL